MYNRKAKEKAAKQTVYTLSIIFILGLIPLAWFGLCKHEDYPFATLWLVVYCFFVTYWFGKIGGEIIHHWTWKIAVHEPSNEIEYEKLGYKVKENKK